MRDNLASVAMPSGSTSKTGRAGGGLEHMDYYPRKREVLLPRALCTAGVAHTSVQTTTCALYERTQDDVWQGNTSTATNFNVAFPTQMVGSRRGKILAVTAQQLGAWQS